MSKKKESLSLRINKVPPIAPSATSNKLLYNKLVKSFTEVLDGRRALSQKEMPEFLTAMGFVEEGALQEVKDKVAADIFRFFEEEGSPLLESSIEIGVSAKLEPDSLSAERLPSSFVKEMGDSPNSAQKGAASTKESSGCVAESHKTEEDIPEII